MLASIVNKLKTGVVKNVVPFGGSSLPAPPYVVVRPRLDPLERGWIIEVNVHFEPGQQHYLWNYVISDLMTLLDDYETLDSYGNDNQLLTEQEIQGIIVNNDDGTISMGRRFLFPSRTF